MTYQDDSTLSAPLLEQLTTQGLDALPDLFRTLLNAAMQIERHKYIGATPHERTQQRTGHANGYKDKTLATHIGQITVAVPQVREGGFYPQSLEKGTRSERALKLALAEMYVQGVSTRKVAAITEQLCGFEVSSGQVSQAAQQLDATLSAWREQPLWACPYVYLDARYERVRQAGLVHKAAVLMAVGVDTAGKRSVLGVSVALSEHEVHWRLFVPAQSGGTGSVRGATDHQRCSRRIEGSAAGGVWGCSVAAVPVPFVAERFGVCAPAGDEGAGGFRCQGDLPGIGSRARRSSAETGCAEIRTLCTEMIGLAGSEFARRLGCVFLS